MEALALASLLHLGHDAGSDPLSAALDYREHLAEVVREAEQPPEPPPAPAPAPAASGGTVWDRLAECESGGNWAYNGSSGYDGGLQFLPSTWAAVAPSGYPAYAWQASREQQIAAAEILLTTSGWGAWPTCSAELGLN